MHEDKLKGLIHQLKKRLRLAMNGVASSDMRDRGLNYKLNFGVAIPQLKKIAGQFPKSNELAGYCWKSQSREMKILSAMLQPVESVTREMAEERVNNMPTVEIAQLYCMYLFQYLSFAEEKAAEWLQTDETLTRITGYLLLTRLLSKQEPVGERTEELFLYAAKKDIYTDLFGLKKAAVDCLKNFGRINVYADSAASVISPFKNSTVPEEKELYEDVQFYWDFHAGKLNGCI